MAAVFCCLRLWWNGTGLTAGQVPQKDAPSVKLDTDFIGQDVVIVKNGRRICGTGAALADAPLAQDKAYFEVKIQSSGVWGVGLATRKCNLSNAPLGNDTESWVVRHDGVLIHNNDQKAKLAELPQEGDIVGISYDHVELNLYLNGKPLNTPFCGIKGTVYPVFYVDEGATMDVQFSNFYHSPPDGFAEIMIEKSLL